MRTLSLYVSHDADIDSGVVPMSTFWPFTMRADSFFNISYRMFIAATTYSRVSRHRLNSSMFDTEQWIGGGIRGAGLCVRYLSWAISWVS